MLAPSLFLLAQGAQPPGVSAAVQNLANWLVVLGDPNVSVDTWFGPFLTWSKILALLSLLAWIAARVGQGIKDRTALNNKVLDAGALIGMLGLLATCLINVLESTKRINPVIIASTPLTTILAIVFGLMVFVWVEYSLWSVIGRTGRKSDRFVLAGIHLAAILGLAAAWFLQGYSAQMSGTERQGGLQYVLVGGARLGATYMGAVVLFQMSVLFLMELVAVRPRRLYAIAWQTWVESFRRMQAFWVVMIVFVVVLAFTHWFLRPSDDRVAEIGRQYVGTLSTLCWILLISMITILTPISLPNDIRGMTIYSIVSKPVRRLELIWGRLLGFMALSTLIVAIFGGISLTYLWRNVYLGAIVQTEAAAKKAASENRLSAAKQLGDQAAQLRTRMSARVPVKGSLTFLDSRGTPQYKGIDVGQELEYRSFVEGATPSAAIWVFGESVPDPLDPKKRINKKIPVEDFLKANTIEWYQDEIVKLRLADARASGVDPTKATSKDLDKAVTSATQNKQEIERLTKEYENLTKQAAVLMDQAAKFDGEGKSAEALKARRDAAKFRSPRIPLEMTFTVYRTTKGRVVGEPVFAELEVVNPFTGEKYNNIIPIREYYTNKELIPAQVLAGSNGALRIVVRCISPTQYLGMAESDLYLLSSSGNFGWNFVKGLVCIWLQAMVLTAIGVFAGTFLSWPVALLTTLAFGVAGVAAFGFLQQFAISSMAGGGPLESLIRLVTHDNMQTELTPTLAVVTAKTFDSLIMPVMTRLVYIVPNFGALDVSNTVALGYAVTTRVLLGNIGLALAYVLPFTVTGFFILKSREVAA